MTCILVACTHIQAILTLEDSDELRSAEVGVQTWWIFGYPLVI